MNDFIERVLSEKYQYKISSSEFIGEGWMSKAYLLNSDTILRVAKSEYASEDLYKEHLLMPYVNKKISINTPVIDILDCQENGKHFMTYPLLDGVFLDRENFRHLSIKQKNQFLTQLVKIMDQLNSVKVEEELMEEYTIDIRQDYIEEYEMYKQRVLPLLDRELREKIQHIYEAYINNKKHFSFEPKLIHRDISFDHLLFDKQTNECIGLIDFGDMTFSDPDLEYMYLLEEFGLEFTKKIMRLRQNKDTKTSLDKVCFFLLTDNISIIDEGVKKSNHDLILEGIALVKKTLLQYY